MTMWSDIQITTLKMDITVKCWYPDTRYPENIDVLTLLSSDIKAYGYSIRSAYSICFDIQTEYPDIESESEQLYSYHATYANL
jgi:hypothetical protein